MSSDVFTPNTDISEDENFAIQEISQAFNSLQKTLDSILSDGRYKSLAYTHLENAAMWANKSIAKDGLL